MPSFFEKLDSLTYSINRLDLTNMELLDEIPDEFTEQLTTADINVLCCNWEHRSLSKEYEPFSVKMNNPLSKEEMSFLEKHRLDVLTNPLIRGFYADVMCNAQAKPNGKYARMLVQDYIWVLDNHNHYHRYDYLNVLRSLIYNSEKYRSLKEETKDSVLRFIRSSDLDDKICTLTMLRKYGYLSAQETISLSVECNIVGNLTDNYFTNQEFYETLIHCYGTSEKAVLKPLYVALAKNQDKNLVRKPYSVFDAKWLYAKYEYLLAAEREDEAQECYKLFMDAKSSGRGLQHFTHQVSISNEAFQPFKNILLSAESPFYALATDDRLIPATDGDAFDPFAELKRLGISMYKFDNNGNPHDWMEYEKKHGQLQSYSQNYTILTITTIMITLRSLIEMKKFSYDTIVDYFNQTWFGEPRIPVNASLQENHESWMTTISPALKLLLTEIQAEVESEGKYKGDYVCAIDSLTMKIEGCIRDACRRVNIATVTPSHNEILLEELLDKMAKRKCPEGSALISPRTQKMLLAILTKQGWNLRNNIAHGFTSSGDYNIQTALSVLHCLLKVSAINVE